MWTIQSYHYITVVLAFSLFQSAQSHNCANVVEIESQGLLNYLANVSFPAPHSLDGEWVMQMQTDLEFTFLGGWDVWITSNPEEKRAVFRSRQDDLKITPGDMITFRFRISWTTGQSRPEVVSLVWDDVQICEGRSPSQYTRRPKRRMLNSTQTIIHGISNNNTSLI